MAQINPPPLFIFDEDSEISKHTIISKLQRKVPLLINLINKSKNLCPDCCIIDVGCSKRAPWTLKFELYEKVRFCWHSGADKILSEIYHPSLSPYCTTKEKNVSSSVRHWNNRSITSGSVWGATREVITQFEK